MAPLVADRIERPPSLFDFVEGVLGWTQRVTAYAFLLVTDRYPPFQLTA